MIASNQHPWLRTFRAFLLLALPGGVFLPGLPAQEGSAWLLKTNTVVTSAGVHLADVVVQPANVALPHVRIADAPAFGASLALTAAQLNPGIFQATTVDPGTNWTGAAQVLISRRARTLTGPDVEQLLTDKLTAEFLSQGGELELRLKRPWTDVPIPDEPFEVKVMQLPAQGISQVFSLRFELVGATETFGSWQVPVGASLWKDVWVVSRAMKRGELLQPAELGRERRDLLTSRNHLAVDALEPAPNEWELAETLASGAPLNRWSLRRKPVVYRGQLADALVHNGPLTISLKVQVLEDAIPGQSVRIRNPNTKRELPGKVNHDQTISIQL
jgi:flagella basal body P-ring formation protein FlgA